MAAEHPQQGQGQSEERNLAMLVHGLVALTGLSSILSFLAPIGWISSVVTVVLYFVWKSKGEFVVSHAKQAAGFQVILFLVGILLGVVLGGAVAAMTLTGSLGTALALGGFLALIVWAIGIGAIVLGIMGLLKAQKGETYRYPLIGKMVEGLKI